MIILLIALIYLIGCVLSFGRSVASFYELDENYPELCPTQLGFEYFVTALSWLGFISGVAIYRLNRERYFFKWSKKPLWKKYHENKF